MELISTQREYEALEKEIKDASLKEQSLRKSLLAKEKYLGELSEQIEEHEQLMEIQEEEVQSETKKKDALLDSKNKEVEELVQKKFPLLQELMILFFLNLSELLKIKQVLV